MFSYQVHLLEEIFMIDAFVFQEGHKRIKTAGFQLYFLVRTLETIEYLFL